eukprot:1277232-Ditylum_brightwellii.AAC.1
MPQCMICSIEESVLWCVHKGKTNKHNYVGRTKHLTSYSDPDCKIIAHAVWPAQSVMQGDHTYCKTKITHLLAVQLSNFARNQLLSLSARSNQGTLPGRYQHSDNEDDTSTLSDPH